MNQENLTLVEGIIDFVTIKTVAVINNIGTKICVMSFMNDPIKMFCQMP